MDVPDPRAASPAARAARRAVRAAAAAVAALALLPGGVTAHVEYVTPDDDGGSPVALIARALGEPLNVALLAGSTVLLLGAVAGYLRYRPAARDIAVLRTTLAEYRDLLPWLLRLAVGLPLVGAGFGGYFFSPAVDPAAVGLPPGVVRLFGVGAGFFLLFGLATRAVAGAALAAYLAGLAAVPALLLAFEFVPGLLAVVLVGGGRPSADHVLSRLAAADTLYARVDPLYRRIVVPFERAVTPLRPYVATVLRVGLGVSFVYLGVAQKLLRPGAALAVVEKYGLTGVVPVAPELWVVGAGLAEVALGLALFVGVFTRAASGAAFGLFTLTLFGLPDDPVLAHVSLFGLVSALLITGAGPLSVDAALASRLVRDDDRRAADVGAPAD